MANGDPSRRHPNIFSLINLAIIIGSIVLYVGVDHQRIAEIERDNQRLQIQLDLIGEHSIGTPERLREIERRVGKIEDKMDILLKLVK
jgi:hypothetical protein